MVKDTRNNMLCAFARDPFAEWGEVLWQQTAVERRVESEVSKQPCRTDEERSGSNRNEKRGGETRLTFGLEWRKDVERSNGLRSQKGRERQELFNYPSAEARSPRRCSFDSSRKREKSNHSTTQDRPLATCTISDHWKDHSLLRAKKQL